MAKLMKILIDLSCHNLNCSVSVSSMSFPSVVSLSLFLTERIQGSLTDAEVSVWAESVEQIWFCLQNDMRWEHKRQHSDIQ